MPHSSRKFARHPGHTARFGLVAAVLCLSALAQFHAHAAITLPSNAPAPTSASGNAGNGLVFVRYTVPAPTGVAATQATVANKVTITWNAADPNTKYEVYRGTTRVTVSGGVSGTSFDDTTVSGITPYAYTVIALADGGISSPSTTVNGYAAVDTTTWVVSATDGTVTDSVTITWGQITGATGYYVQRNGTTIATINNPSTLSVSDSRVGDNTVYTYGVIPVTASGPNVTKTDTGYANVTPTALSGSITTHMDTASAAITPSVTDANPSDTYTFLIATQPAHGSASVVSNKVVFTPAGGYQGTDSFTVTAIDKGGASVTGSISVLVNCPDFTTNWTVTATDGTVTDKVNLTWTAVYCAQGFRIARDGTTIATINSGTKYAYSDTRTNDPTTYTYTVTAFNPGGDGPAKTDTGFANVTPTALSGTITTHMDTASTGITPTVTDANPTDTYTFAIATQPTQGAASVMANKVIFTPTASYQGTDSFTVTATDKGGATVTGPIAVTVNCPDFATNWTLEATNGTLTDKVTLTWANVYCAQGYTVARDGTPITTISSAATVTYDDLLSNDPVVHTYSVTPFNLGGSGTAKTDTGYANVAPSALTGTILAAPAIATDPGVPTVTDANVPVTGDTFTYVIVTQGAQGTATVVNNQIVYTSSGTAEGTDSFTVRATDRAGASVVGIVTVTITCPNPGIIGLDFDATLVQLAGAAQVSPCGLPAAATVTISVSQLGVSMLNTAVGLTATANPQLFSFGASISNLVDGSYIVLATLVDAYHNATFSGTLTVDWHGAGNAVFTNNGAPASGSTTTTSFGFIGVQ